MSEMTNTEFTTHNTASGTQLTSTDDTLRINIITNKCLITILCYFVVYGNDFVFFQSFGNILEKCKQPGVFSSAIDYK